jgi:2'-5' RNA ligase
MNKQQYMFAIMPPTELGMMINEIRQQFAIKYHCKAALKPPVHITVIPPFHTFPEREPEIIKEFSASASGIHPFDIELSGYGIFSRKGVVFMNVILSGELKGFQAIANQRFTMILPGLNRDTGRPYHPHITIGYRDIPKELFRQAAEEYLDKSFEESFSCDRFFLWRHDGKAWQVHHEFILS